MNTPTIYGRETTWRAYRLWCAVVSTGAESAAQEYTLCGDSEAVKTLVARLEWLADGPKINWVKVLAAARRAVKNALTASAEYCAYCSGDGCADCDKAGFDHRKLVEAEQHFFDSYARDMIT